MDNLSTDNLEEGKALYAAFRLLNSLSFFKIVG